ncbi:MAG: beta-propeller domain-containing protein [Polyangia bacterium]
MKRHSTLFPVFLFGVVTACGDSGLPEPAGIQAELQLSNFGSCADLEQYVEDQAVFEMRTQLESMKRSGGSIDIFGRTTGVADSAAAPAAGAADSSKSSGPSAYTKTNTQVAGVDEADFFKNDGTRIFQLVGQKLYAVKSWPANAMQIQSSMNIEGYPTQMYLDEKNRVVVFSSIYTQYTGYLEDWAVGGRGGVAADVACGPGYCGGWYGNTTKVTVIDVSDLTNLKVQNEFFLPGNYANSRRVGSSVRLVLSDHFRWPSTVKFYPDSSTINYNDWRAWNAELDRLKDANEKIIRDQTLDKWLPAQKVRTADGTVKTLPYNCSDFAKHNAPTHLGITTVATINLDAPQAAPQRSSILGEVGEIYANQNALYLTNRHWWWWPRFNQRDWTYLFKFDLSDVNKARFVAAGGVDGHIVDQFSMDEDKGFFRVATTIAERVQDPKDPRNYWGIIQTTNRVTVMGQNGGKIQTVGQSEELAKGERIYSSRFMGDRGFVVTYRQVDPLYTFDLSNPASPRKVGELKIPGFSTYIHPLDANNLLTIGIYTPETGTGPRSLQLSIFDVSDFANPKQKWTQLVGSSYGWSEATYEHKAFNYFPERKMLAIPFSDWSYSGTDPWGSFRSELKVFDIDVATGFKLRGSVSMKDVYQSAGLPTWAWYYSPWMRRSVMATDMGTDYVYAVSDAGIRAVTGPTLGTTLSTVVFPRYDVLR